LNQFPINGKISITYVNSIKSEEEKMELTALNVRKRILKMANACGGSVHMGGIMSMVELLTVLYRDVLKYDFTNTYWEERDRFILSKGHNVLTLFAILTECGVITEEEAATYYQDGSIFGSHPVMDLEHGIESSNGSLGQGISMAVGIAKAAKIKGKDYNVYTLIGDGEAQEGSVWEAAMLAAQWKLDNLTVILDYNKYQGDGLSTEIVDLFTNARERFESFGFTAINVDGHDEEAIKKAFLAPSEGKPKIIIADTIKGKGISFMEGNNDWHHNRLTQKLYEEAMAELEVNA